MTNMSVGAVTNMYDTITYNYSNKGLINTSNWMK